MLSGGRTGWLLRQGGRLLGLLCLLGVSGCCVYPSENDYDRGDQGPPDQGPPQTLGWFTNVDGVEVYSACDARFIGTACGVVDAQPYYATYDGCNWCVCSNGGVSCTARACDGDLDGGVAQSDAGPVSDAGVDGPEGWTEGDCVPYEDDYGCRARPTGWETWMRDAEGRVFRSACLPAGLVAAP
ncbi:MAG: hypothetical protein IPG81_28280 [Sandaracinaceae bacterium]|nr:hypothetical protein [Sandaracinaceae bacterium]